MPVSDTIYNVEVQKNVVLNDERGFFRDGQFNGRPSPA